jgi:predicted enzyme related to lactoylglutathione lyase
MALALVAITVDCGDAAKLAEFWAAALGRPVEPGATPERAAVAPDDSGATGPRLAFQQVPEPKSVKNRLHLDLVANTFEAESQRLVALGASPIRDMSRGSARWTTFGDPEGNEFDLIAG